MMKKHLKSMSVLASLMLLAGVIVAQPYGNQERRQQANWKVEKQYKEGKRGTRGAMICERLDLSTEQQEQMDKLRVDHQKKVLPLRNQLGEKKAKMRSLTTVDNADMKAINKLIDEMGAIKVKMQKERAAHKQEVRKILTEEQRLQFDMHRRGNAKQRNRCK